MNLKTIKDLVVIAVAGLLAGGVLVIGRAPAYADGNQTNDVRLSTNVDSRFAATVEAAHNVRHLLSSMTADRRAAKHHHRKRKHHLFAPATAAPTSKGTKTSAKSTPSKTAPSGGSTPRPGNPRPNTPEGQIEAAIVSDLSQARTGRGLSTVATEGCLDDWSAAWAQHDVAADVLDHSSLQAAYRQCPWPTAWLGEAIGEIPAGAGSPSDEAACIVSSWLASDEHRAIVLHDPAARVGVSVALTRDGQNYVVIADFGA